MFKTVSLYAYSYATSVYYQKSISAAKNMVETI